MSTNERNYFSFRYMLPGYAFLTTMLIINIELLNMQISEVSNGYTNTVTLIGIISGILSLLSASAIGFIISQFWYVVYNYYWKSHKKLTKRRSQIELMNVGGIKKYIEKDTEDEDRVSIMAYILTSVTNERISKYIDQLNDIINSLASTFFGILLGLSGGYYLRLCIFQHTIRCYDVTIILVSFTFILIILLNLRIVLSEHDSIARLVIILHKQEIKKKLNHI